MRSTRSVIFARFLLASFFAFTLFGIWFLDGGTFVLATVLPALPTGRTKTEERRTLRFYNRLRAIFRRSGTVERQRGASWYFRAMQFIHGEALAAGVPLKTAAKATAELSSNARWSNNRDALRYVLARHAGNDASKPWGILERSYKRAFALVEGRETETNGPKVTPFAENLSGNLQPVTIDGQMMKGVADLATKSITRPTRAAMCRAVKMLATQHGYEPAQMQAILWMQIRKENGHAHYA